MRIRRPTGPSASPLPDLNDNRINPPPIAIVQPSIGGDR
jgi:hypothetical protein